MKDFEAAARYILTEIGEDRWDGFGGCHRVLGVEKAGCFVRLPASTKWDDAFTEADYLELCDRMITEELWVSDELTPPDTEIEVIYEGVIHVPEKP